MESPHGMRAGSTPSSAPAARQQVWDPSFLVTTACWNVPMLPVPPFLFFVKENGMVGVSPVESSRSGLYGEHSPRIKIRELTGCLSRPVLFH